MNYKNIIRLDKLDRVFQNIIDFEYNIELCRKDIEYYEKRLIVIEVFIGPHRDCIITSEYYKNIIEEHKKFIKEYIKIIETILKNNPEIEPQYILHKLIK